MTGELADPHVDIDRADWAKLVPVSEIIFIVEEDPEGGYTARAVGESIFTQAEDPGLLQERVRDAVRCHFDEDMAPKPVVAGARQLR